MSTSEGHNRDRQAAPSLRAPPLSVREPRNGEPGPKPGKQGHIGDRKGHAPPGLLE